MACRNSEFNLLGDSEGIFDLDAEVSNRAFKLRVPQQQLDRTQVSCLAINLGGFCPPHGVRPVSRTVQACAIDPSVNYTGVLARRQVGAFMESARKKVAGVRRLQQDQPFTERRPGLFGDFKLDRSPCFSLYDGCSIANPTSNANVLGLKGDQITSAKLTVDRQIEECEVTL